MKITSKILVLLAAALLLLCPAVSAQETVVGKFNAWTFCEIYSREKDDEILPVSYKMRVSRNKNFDRIVFEFAEKEVPEYAVGYADAPITNDPAHIENPLKPKPEELVKIKGKYFVTIGFALGFDGQKFGRQFSGEQNLTVIQDVESVDWFENYYTFAVGLKSRKPFRVAELSNPTRLVIDFKSFGK